MIYQLKILHAERFITKHQSWISISILGIISILLYIDSFYDIDLFTFIDNKELSVILFTLVVSETLRSIYKAYKDWSYRQRLIERSLVFIMNNVKKQDYYKSEYNHITNELEKYDLDDINDEEIFNLLYIIENELYYCVYKNKKWRKLLEAIIKNNIKRGNINGVRQEHIDLFERIKCGCKGIISEEALIRSILGEEHKNNKMDDMIDIINIHWCKNYNNVPLGNLKTMSYEDIKRKYDILPSSTIGKLTIKDKHKIKDEFFYNDKKIEIDRFHITNTTK